MRRLVEPVLVVPRVLLDGTLAPEQVDVVLQREEVESAPGQDVGLVLGVDGIAGVLWSKLNELNSSSGVRNLYHLIWTCKFFSIYSQTRLLYLQQKPLLGFFSYVAA